MKFTAKAAKEGDDPIYENCIVCTSGVPLVELEYPDHYKPAVCRRHASAEALALAAKVRSINPRLARKIEWIVSLTNHPQLLNLPEEPYKDESDLLINIDDYPPWLKLFPACVGPGFPTWWDVVDREARDEINFALDEAFDRIAEVQDPSTYKNFGDFRARYHGERDKADAQTTGDFLEVLVTELYRCSIASEDVVNFVREIVDEAAWGLKISGERALKLQRRVDDAINRAESKRADSSLATVIEVPPQEISKLDRKGLWSFARGYSITKTQIGLTVNPDSDDPAQLTKAWLRSRSPYKDGSGKDNQFRRAVIDLINEAIRKAKIAS